MVRYRRLTLFCLLLLQIGCARLDVRVDILDPAYVRDIRTLLNNQDLVRASANQDVAYLDAAIREICQAYQRGRVGVYDAAIQRAQRISRMNAAGAQGLQNTLQSTQNSRDEIVAQSPTKDCVQSFDSEYGFVDREALKEDFLAIGCPDGECIESGAIDHEHAGQQVRAAARFRSRLAGYSDEVRRKVVAVYGLLQLTGAFPSNSDAPEKQQVEQIAEESAEEVTESVTRRGYLGANGQTLVYDEIAFGAANAPEDRWEERYNRAKGFGLWGSTDMVIKLNDTADFSVAGLVFDARATAIAVRKLTTSALQILASGQGLPIKVDSGEAEGEDDTSAIADANANVVEANARLEANALAARNYRVGLRRIAIALLQSADVVNGTGTSNTEASQQTRREAREFANSQFRANEPLLKAAAGEEGEE